VHGFLAGGRVFDLVLACLVTEAAVLAVFRAVHGRPLLPADVLAQLCAAAGLVMAARSVLAGAWWGFTGLCLAAALGAHVAALWMRWPHAGRPASPGRRAFSPGSLP